MLNSWFKKTQTDTKKSDHDLFMDELFKSNNNDKEQYKSIFKYDSVNQYKSIHTYDNLNRETEMTIDNYTRPDGMEVIFNYGIIGIFYLFMIVLFPFSLFVCLKRVKENERMIVYRLGRIVKPEIKPGYCICFPIIDSYKKITTTQKEFSLPNLQILSYENAIIDTTTIIRYEITDAIKLTNTLEDLNSTLKSVARGYLVNGISKKDTIQIEKEKSYIIQDFTKQMNEYIKRWGLKITNVEITINSVQMDENEGEDPALKTISLVFKSLLGGDSSTTTVTPPSASGVKPSSLNELPNDLMKFVEGLSKPMVIPHNADMANLAGSPFGSLFPGMMNQATTSQASTVINMEAPNSSSDSNQMSAFQILKLLEPLINESLVNEIQKVYEFHIKSKSDSNKVEIFHLDLKTMQKGKVGAGPAPFAVADCIIKLSDEDLNELLTDNLKPFTAYMSGRIEIDGDLQDVFKLKKLINSVSQMISSMNLANK